MIKAALRSMLANTGSDRHRKDHFNILRPDNLIGFTGDEEARRGIETVRDHTMVAYAALVSLWQQIRFCEEQGLAGDYVECGVWKGGSVGLMALANLAYGANRRRIHLFDAFDDICEPDPEVDGERAMAEVEKFAGRDRATITGKLAPVEGFYEHLGGPGRFEDVKQYLEHGIGYDPAHLIYHQGWFQDTLPVAEISQIAVLRLDGDWYASTRICLEHLYDQVVPGGFVIIDDYGCYDGCRKAVDEFLAGRGQKLFLNHVTTDCRYWIKP